MNKKSAQPIQFDSISLEDTQKLAKQLLASLKGKNVILLEGELGAGKTTFAQGILKELGAEGPFTSPTFVVMKDYLLNPDTGFKRIFHLDCYRIAAPDLKELGWEEIVSNKNNLVLVEWPERIMEALPKEYVHVKIELVDQEIRRFFIKSN